MKSYNRTRGFRGKKMRGGNSGYSEYAQAELATGGGKRRFGGRGLFTDMAVPAILLYANNAIGKSKSYKSVKSHKFRKPNKRKTRFTRRKR